ncbi:MULTISPECIES: VOC family protein [Pseudoalteromonas]|uniref:Putative ring-cleavage extradiol dioxygenase n=1 Tax=Pseudoalteromonas luteoviolacea (strain 2ta16) TaxID=1353533 RepID=V4I350_PSEL2|nr:MULTISPECIES: VOC family protein [Pseudoalteromonas]ESP94664.1 putative ring-cleavage extradiol dioxygenase [Pseudoalteromonas luteoviolacea 2ta16]KZN43471.1 glyoxalase [Pseudoalteromonas luteoviolacea NCIMB 1944]MCG7547502.1 VOC family protein [Pseudoalteromonas sp. Of7M-16]
METKEEIVFPDMQLSHIELYVQDLAKMETFYTSKLGFVVTDRGEGQNGMVFLSRSQLEHHQIVLSPIQSRRTQESPIDHISFRVKNIDELKLFNSSLKSVSGIRLQAVSHGTTWSIYFYDPENNRFEIFTDTPWYVNQPCKFAVNLELSNEELIKFTENEIKNMRGFSPKKDWETVHKKNLGALD